MPSVRTPGPCGGAGGMLFLNEKHSDVAIIVEYGDTVWRYPAHSLLLSTMSKVLEMMLESDMSEKCTKQIKIADSNPSAIKHFLRYVYTGEVGVSEWREVLELLTVAHKYQVEPLIGICEKQLLQSMSLASVCLLHEIGQLYSLDTLLTETRKLILDGAFVIAKTEGFENMGKKSIEYFLSSRQLNVENEVMVLHTLKQWAIAECSRSGQILTKENILAIMEPLLKHVRFKQIHPSRRKLVPDSLIQDQITDDDTSRVKFFVPSHLHSHMTSLKFVVELGSFVHKSGVTEPLLCLKLCSDRNLYILGFRIVGMFRNNFTFGSGNPMLVLGKEGNRSYVQFDLSSVPWKGGSTVGDYIWREIVAYFPHPARLDPFSCYTLTVKYGNLIPTKWPRTRVENNNLTTDMGAFTIFTFGQCAGVTEIFLLPAAPAVSSCNDMYDS